MHCRLIYSCHATREVYESDLHDISGSSSRRNPTRDITGVLLYANRRFIQVLEGPGGSIFELITLISSDERASSLRIESVQKDVDPIFEDWAMLVTDANNPVDAISTEFNEMINLFVTRPGSADMHAELDRRCENLHALLKTEPDMFASS